MRKTAIVVVILISFVLLVQASGSFNLESMSYTELEVLRDLVLKEMEEKQSLGDIPNSEETDIATASPSFDSAPEATDYRILEVGSKGEDVLAARIRLFELGYFTKMPTQVDFTPNMKDYVIEFQKHNALNADGMLTPDVQKLLFSEDAKPKPVPVAKLNKPTNVKISVSGIWVVISWSSVDGADSYNIYRSSSNQGTYTKIATVKETKYSDKAPSRGKTYYYKVEAIAENNQSDQTSSFKAVIPTPAPTAVPEPKYPLEDTGYGDSGTSYGYKWFKNNYKNTSTKYTVDGFTIAYYATNVYGEKIKAHGFGEYIQYEIINKTIKPGKQGQTPKITAYGFEDAKRIHAAVSKIHLTNGTTIEIPESDRQYWYYEY